MFGVGGGIVAIPIFVLLFHVDSTAQGHGTGDDVPERMSAALGRESLTTMSSQYIAPILAAHSALLATFLSISVGSLAAGLADLRSPPSPAQCFSLAGSD